MMRGDTALVTITRLALTGVEVSKRQRLSQH
jgi:hypothetical protein